MAFYDQDELATVGFRRVGVGVRVSKLASIYNPSAIEIGDHSRIDDFCVLSAGEDGIYLGRYVHIAVHCSLIGRGKIVLDEFSGLSSHVSIYSSTDDYSGIALTNPTVPAELSNVTHEPVTLGPHVIVGAGAVILPGVKLAVGCAVGALSLVTRSFAEFSIVSGVPARRISERRRDILELEKRLTATKAN